MVAELAAQQHRRTGLGMRRAEAAGSISTDRFSPRRATGLGGLGTVVQFAIYSLAVVGAAFVPFFWSADMSADGAAQQPGVPPPGVNEFQQMMAMLQQVAQAQQQQQTHLETLQHAIGTTAQGVGLTQQVTEGVVTEVVQQVQASMQQRQQETQDQLQQVMSAVQGLNQRIDQVQLQSAASMPVAGTVPASAHVPQQMPLPGSPSSPVPPQGSPTHGQPAFFANHPGMGQLPGVGGAGINVNPAIAYALQQGGVDSKVLAKPTVYDPVKHAGYAAFNDWADHIITCLDAQIPGTWEILEYIKDNQPSTMMSLDDLNLHFPNIDRATLEYSNSNLYAVLITYTLNEARNIVRQARRPNGYEAWKMLHKRFNPVTIGRQRAGLTSIANPTSNVPLAQLSGEIIAWEAKITEFESRPGAEKISESIRMAAMVSMCPTKLKDHLQLNAQRFKSYLELREEIFMYLDNTQSVSSTAMDVGSLQKGSGCYVCGGPHLARDCPKKSQKGGAGFGKGGKDKGKGKSFSKDKGKGKKGAGAGVGKNGAKGKGKSVCSNCGKTGHSRDQCWHLQQAKPLNSIDPRLSQLQSEYAKRAVEEFQRMNGPSDNSGRSAIPSGSVSGPSTVSSSLPLSSASQVQVGGVSAVKIKPLGALSLGSSKKRQKHEETSGERSAVKQETQRLQRFLNMDTFCVRSNLDSGAAISVAPPDAFPGYPVLPSSEGSTLSLIAANGEEVQHFGEVHPVVISDEGHLRTMRFQVAAVNKVLTSAAQVANYGYRVVMDGKDAESYIEDKELGDKFKLHQEDGIYVHYLHVVPYVASEDFPGQPSGSASTNSPQV
eukprot:s364_g28.t1